MAPLKTRGITPQSPVGHSKLDVLLGVKLASQPQLPPGNRAAAAPGLRFPGLPEALGCCTSEAQGWLRLLFFIGVNFLKRKEKKDVASSSLPSQGVGRPI
jgi:hypothetical protein